MLMSKIRRRLAIPDEPNDWMELRALSGKKLEEASWWAQRKAIEMAKLAGQEFIDAMETYRADLAEAEVKANPLQQYDIETLVRSGIVAWSYEMRLTPENIAELDSETREWAAREILKLTEESQEERKSKA